MKYLIYLIFYYNYLILLFLLKYFLSLGKYNLRLLYLLIYDCFYLILCTKFLDVGMYLLCKWWASYDIMIMCLKRVPLLVSARNDERAHFNSSQLSADPDGSWAAFTTHDQITGTGRCLCMYEAWGVKQLSADRGENKGGISCRKRHLWNMLL